MGWEQLIVSPDMLSAAFCYPAISKLIVKNLKLCTACERQGKVWLAYMTFPPPPYLSNPLPLFLGMCMIWYLK